MDDDVPPAVEFLGDGSGAGAEEVLAAPPSRHGRTTLVVLVGGPLFVGAPGAAIARGRAGGERHGARSAGLDRPTAAAVSGPVPVAGGGADAGSAALIDCPDGAQCSVWIHAPAATLGALR